MSAGLPGLCRHDRGAGSAARRVLAAGLAGLMLALAGCRTAAPPTPAPVPTAPVAPSPAEPAARLPAEPPAPASALALGVRAASLEDALPGAAEALAAFRLSCPALARRADSSGLAQAADWAAPCAQAALPAAAADPAGFFRRHFAPVEVGDGNGFATGYFEPELAGARTRSDAFPHPLYRLPPDLVEADLGAFDPALRGRVLRGRVEGRRFLPYHDRAAIDGGALAGRGLELAWVADPHELFFLHIQGSGRIRLPDGQVLRVGYAGQNGHRYVAVGRLLVERGTLPRGQAGMEAILAWMRANPETGRALMHDNPSYIFFRELTGPGPVGSLGVALTPGASIAADPAFLPLGAPVLVATTTADGQLTRLTVAQDTGGAIRGANRIDIFFGAGAQARRLAGVQAAPARLVLLLPRTAAQRLGVAPLP
jgi:membrane-bound lytic murein transglycosylase A